MTEPDLNLLQALDTLLAEASVTAAARKLGLSTSAMSRTLTRLREVTGDALLVRAGRDMVLTPHAMGLRERTQQALQQARALLQPAPAALDLAGLQRSFTIRANEGFVEVFGAPLIAAVSAAAPQVQLHFVPKPHKGDAPLREGRIDLEIGVLGNMGPEVRVQALFRDRFVAVVRQGHALAMHAQPSAEAYAACGHVVATRRGRSQGPVDEALAALGLTRRIVASVPSFPAALAMARASDLVALVPASFWHSQAGSPCVALELPVPTAAITVSQMWHPRLDAEPQHRWLRQTVREVVQQLGGAL